MRHYDIDHSMNVQAGARPASMAVQAFVTRVFSIMGVGLGITGAASLITLNVPALLKLAVQMQWVLMIGELVLVFYLARSFTRMKPDTALGWFLFYSALNGVVFSPIFLIYTRSSIASAFFIAAGMFGAMALWGLTTRKDLTSMGSLAFMGLIGIIIASVVNLFMRSSGLQLAISYIGVGVFIGLTAWDAQKIKRMAETGAGGSIAVMGALMLYLDFINLFLHLLYILGGRRD